MNDAGLSFKLVVFWDDVARLARFRSAAAHALFKGDKSVGAPSAPTKRRDKNVQSWTMTALRFGLYLADALSVRFQIKKMRRSETDTVIFDRFIYDELTNLRLENRVVRCYVRLIMKFTPKPHISYLLDADPPRAYARKPEYPLEFLYANRKAYLLLSELIGGMTVIAPMSIGEVEQTVWKHALKELSLPSFRNKGTPDAHSMALSGR
jgi:hypothetical protein